MLSVQTWAQLLSAMILDGMARVLPDLFSVRCTNPSMLAILEYFKV
jgi:hypothetical protein